MDNEEKDLKAQQAGRDVAEVGAKAAGTYFGGAAGAKAVDIASKTKTGGAILDAAGKSISKIPIVRSNLAKNQENIQNLKPIANAAINKNSNGQASNSNDTGPTSNEKSDLNNPNNDLSEKKGLDNKNNDLDNNDKGLKSNDGIEDSSKKEESSSSSESDSLTDFDKVFKKKKNSLLYFIIAGFFVSIIAIGLFFGMFFQPIIALGEKINQIFDNLGEYADTFTNIVSFKGVGTSEETFWTELNNQYDAFSEQANTEEKLDISLLAATLHYEKVIDPAFYNETDSIEEGNPEEYNGGPIDSLHDKAQAKLFYDWAYSELGNFNTMVISERGLSGALVSTYVSATCEPDTFANNWSNFLNNVGDFGTAIANISLATVQDKLQAWNLFYFFNTAIAKLDAVNFDVVDFVKQQYTQKFVTASNEAYSFAEMFKIPKVTCGTIKKTENGKEQTVPTKVVYDMKLYNDYAKYEKYLRKYYLPLYYINCSNCTYRNSSKEEKEQLIDNMIVEIYELRNVYADIINQKRIDVGLFGLGFEDTVILSGVSSCPVQPQTYISRGWQLGTATCYVNGKSVGKGCNHKGIDFAAASGSPIYSIADGTVTFADYTTGGYGYRIKIDHGNGLVSTYNHLLAGSFYVNVGSSVKEGQQIALMGSTGNSTGPHLHFEVIQQGSLINPATVISCG